MKTKFAGFKIANALIHPSVYISKRNAIGVGSIICEGSTITTNIKIGNFVIINRGSNISHDDSIGDYVTVYPGVNIAGNVTIEEGAYIGVGSSIREKINIGAWSIRWDPLSHHVPVNTLYAGVPAKFKKTYIKSWSRNLHFMFIFRF